MIHICLYTLSYLQNVPTIHLLKLQQTLPLNLLTLELNQIFHENHFLSFL